MKTRVDDRLRDEAARFALRFSCDECAHFDVASASCSLAYPAAPRRDALAGAEIELCKEFDMA